MANSAARFDEFRAALTGKFGFEDIEEANLLAFELSENHPSLEPSDLTPHLLYAFRVEGLKKLREDRKRIDRSQLSEEARQRMLVEDEAFDADLRELIRAEN